MSDSVTKYYESIEQIEWEKRKRVLENSIYYRIDSFFSKLLNRKL